MKTQLIRRLRRLASITYQRKYIIGGTKDEYVLPDELLETTEDLVKLILSKPTSSEYFSERELSCLVAMQAILKHEGDKLPFDGSVSNEDLIENDTAWAAIRSTAQQCLRLFGLDLADWEKRMDTED